MSCVLCVLDQPRYDSDVSNATENTLALHLIPFEKGQVSTL